MFKQLSVNYFGYLKVLCDIHYIMLKYGRDKVNKRKKTKLVEYVLNIMEEKIETELSVEQDELIKSEKDYFKYRKDDKQTKKLIESLEKEKENLEIKLENSKGFDLLTYSEFSSIESDIELLKTSLNKCKCRCGRKVINDIKTKYEKKNEFYEKYGKVQDDVKEVNENSLNEMSTFEETQLSLIQNDNSEETVKKLNKVEEMEVMSKKNDDLKEEVKLNFSFKQVPSMPVFKNNFVLEGLQPVKIEKEEVKVVKKEEEVKKKDEEKKEEKKQIKYTSTVNVEMDNTIGAQFYLFISMQQELLDIISKKNKDKSKSLVKLEPEYFIKYFEMYEKNKCNMQLLLAISIIINLVLLRNDKVKIFKEHEVIFNKMQKFGNYLIEKFEKEWNMEKRELVLKYVDDYY